MKDDFVKNLGYLGVTARLKRLTDNITYSIKELYKEEQCDLEPSWHLVFLYLIEKEHCSMTELAEALQVTTPAILKVCNKMEQKGYVNVLIHPEDNRRKVIRLTDKAKQSLPELNEIWQAGQKAIEEILGSNTHFLDSLEQFENSISENGFKERARRYIR